MINTIAILHFFLTVVRCKTQKKCSHLNGKCIWKHEHCDGKVKNGKAFCDGKDCVCCLREYLGVLLAVVIINKKSAT